MKTKNKMKFQHGNNYEREKRSSPAHGIFQTGFPMMGKCQTVWDFTISRPDFADQWKLEIVWDEWGKIWSFSFFPTRPRFLQGRRRPRWISLITNALNCFRNLRNLGPTSCEYSIYRQNLGWSAQSKIPDHLEVSRHMKTRLLCRDQTCPRLRDTFRSETPMSCPEADHIFPFCDLLQCQSIL